MGGNPVSLTSTTYVRTPKPIGKFIADLDLSNNNWLTRTELAGEQAKLYNPTNQDSVYVPDVVGSNYKKALKDVKKLPPELQEDAKERINRAKQRDIESAVARNANQASGQPDLSGLNNFGMNYDESNMSNTPAFGSQTLNHHNHGKDLNYVESTKNPPKLEGGEAVENEVNIKSENQQESWRTMQIDPEYLSDKELNDLGIIQDPKPETDTLQNKKQSYHLKEDWIMKGAKWLDSFNTKNYKITN